MPHGGGIPPPLVASEMSRPHILTIELKIGGDADRDDVIARRGAGLTAQPTDVAVFL